MLTLAEIYHGYGLLIGMTSYRLANGRYQQSRLTQAYAVILNVFVICTLPFIFEELASELRMMSWLPGMMFIVPYVLYIVNYAVLTYILIVRFRRDSMLTELLDLADRLTRKMERAGLSINPQLRRLLHLKFFTVGYMNSVLVISLFFIKLGFLRAVLVNLGHSILFIATYFHFASIWQIARGYDFVNQQLGSGTTPDEDIRNLWSLHSLLGRMAHKINRIYGLQMLFCRLHYIVATTIYIYIGIVFLRRGVTLLGVHGTLMILVRTLDLFLNDFICELSLRYQCQPKDDLSEGIMSKELSDFLIYESSLQQNLRVCELYSDNRNQWLQMIGFILSNSTLLVQFYLILKEDNLNN